MKAIFLSDRGKVRHHNEDNGGVFFLKDEFVLAVVADGMGGHNAGDVASEMAVAEIATIWESVENFEGPEHIKEWLIRSVNQINEKIYTFSQENKECHGMGTTLVLVICSKEFAIIGHIGDSRCYLNNSNGFKQMTNDHSLVNELVKSGQITREDAESHPRKNVLMRALGTEQQVDVDVTTISWESGDSLLLCSDGLSNKIIEKEIEETVNLEKALQEKAKSLVALANERGGEDNISIAIIEHANPQDEGECEQ